MQKSEDSDHCLIDADAPGALGRHSAELRSTLRMERFADQTVLISLMYSDTHANKTEETGLNPAAIVKNNCHRNRYVGWQELGGGEAQQPLHH